MKLDDLKRANEINKELDNLEDRTDEYENAIIGIKKSGNGTEYIGHASVNFECTTNQLVSFIEGLKKEAEELKEKLLKEFDSL